MTATSDKIYLIMELYSNPYEYSSYSGKFPLIRAVSFDIPSAADIIAKKKIDDLQKLIDEHVATGKNVSPYVSSMFVVQAPVTEFMDIMSLEQIPIEKSHVSPDVIIELEAVTKKYNGLLSDINLKTKNINNYLHVDPSTYVRDRRARELEMMKRFNVKPVLR